jgi:small subunit ribosomal protein S20
MVPLLTICSNTGIFLGTSSPMPNKHASVKDLRKTKRREAQNLRLKTHARALLRKANDLIKEGSAADVKAAIIAFQKIADKAAKNHVINRNAANRRKSKLMKKFATLRNKK